MNRGRWCGVYTPPPSGLQLLEKLVGIFGLFSLAAFDCEQGSTRGVIRNVSRIWARPLAGRPLCNLTHWRALFLSHRFHAAKIGRQTFRSSLLAPRWGKHQPCFGADTNSVVKMMDCQREKPPGDLVESHHRALSGPSKVVPEMTLRGGVCEIRLAACINCAHGQPESCGPLSPPRRSLSALAECL